MTSPRKTEIRWLHLSDFHLRSSLEWSQDVVLRSLLEDVGARFSGSQAPDLLFITGDVAFSGSAEEYRLAEDFIHRLQEAASVPPERLFIIPGNHDIERSLEEDAFRGAHHTLSSGLEVDRFLSNDGRRRTLFRRQVAFRAFANRVAPPSSPYSDVSFAHWKHARVGPIQVVALLLDSAWLAEGGDADAGRLLVGERQVIDAYAASPRPALAFGLVHHPFAWLKNFEQVPVETLLLERVNIMLRGHVHAADLRAVQALEGRLTFFTAGATFETRTSYNSYGSATLDLLKGHGVAVTHRYIHAIQRWQASEPQAWRLLDPAQPRIPLAQALAMFSRDGRPYAHYKAFLVAGHITEVPRQINGRYVLLSSDLSVPGDPNPLGATISAIRHLVHWRGVWDERQWIEEVGRLLEEFHATLDQLAAVSSEVATLIAARERHCAETAPALIMHVDPHQSSLVDNLNHMAAGREFDMVLGLIARAREARVLDLDECRRVDEIEVIALLELGKVPEALARVRDLSKDEPLGPERLYLGAQCYYAAKEYAAAAAHMHRALDVGMDAGRARRLALLIAGHAGDAALSKRVRQP
jgi:UDP-2,3-diacylglucosamine pyrophosphatase LpxH